MFDEIVPGLGPVSGTESTCVDGQVGALWVSSYLTLPWTGTVGTYITPILQVGNLRPRGIKEPFQGTITK